MVQLGRWRMGMAILMKRPQSLGAERMPSVGRGCGGNLVACAVIRRNVLRAPALAVHRRVCTEVIVVLSNGICVSDSTSQESKGAVLT